MTNVDHRAHREDSSISDKVMKVFADVLLFGLLVCVVVGGSYLYQRVDQPFTDVRVGGDFHYLKRDELEGLVADHLNGNFLSIDLHQLQEVMQQHPWIAEVSVSREWPSTLKVVVNEETPIARWGDEGFLNKLGEELRIEDTSDLVGLPVLTSQGGNSQEMMQHYQLLAQMLMPSGLKVVELHRDNLGAWRVVAEQDLELILGRGSIAEKIRRLGQVWARGLKHQTANIDSIDLRYPNGLAVAWKAEELNEKDKSGATKTANRNKTRSVQG